MVNGWLDRTPGDRLEHGPDGTIRWWPCHVRVDGYQQRLGCQSISWLGRRVYDLLAANVVYFNVGVGGDFRFTPSSNSQRPSATFVGTEAYRLAVLDIAIYLLTVSSYYSALGQERLLGGDLTGHPA